LFELGNYTHPNPIDKVSICNNMELDRLKVLKRARFTTLNGRLFMKKKVLIILLTCLAGPSPLKAGLLGDSILIQSVVPLGVVAGDTTSKIIGGCGLALVYGRACLNSYLRKSERDAEPKNDTKPHKISQSELEKRKKTHSFCYALLKGLQVAIPFALAAYSYTQLQGSHKNSVEKANSFEWYKTLCFTELIVQLLF
jgi:hypothetical protein